MFVTNGLSLADRKKDPIVPNFQEVVLEPRGHVNHFWMMILCFLRKRISMSCYMAFIPTPDTTYYLWMHSCNKMELEKWLVRCYNK